MRIIDLSSDVCSSDLPPFRRTSAGGWSIDHPVRRPSASNHARSVLSRAAGASPAMRINFQIAGSLQVPDALCPLDGATNQYRLPTGEVPQFFTPDNRAMYALSNRGRNYQIGRAHV